MPSSRTRRGACWCQEHGWAPPEVWLTWSSPGDVQGVLVLVLGCHVQGHLGPRCVGLPALSSLMCWHVCLCWSHVCSRQVTSLFQAGGKKGQRSRGLCQLRLPFQQTFLEAPPSNFCF